MKQVITLIAATLLFTGNAVASGVWAPQSSSGGGSGGGGECYLVTFNAGTYGTRSLVGNGAVSGSFFTGFLWFPGLASRGRMDCGSGAVGQCAWGNAYSYSNYSVAVSALPIFSAQPTGCY